MQVENIQPGLLDSSTMSDVHVSDNFIDKYMQVANFSDNSHIKLPTLQSLIGVGEPQATPDFFAGNYQKSLQDAKKANSNFDNEGYSVGSIDPQKVMPYVKTSTNYDNNISAAFGQAGKGAVVGGLIASETGPGALVGAAVGGTAGFLSGLLGVSGKQGFTLGYNNQEITAQKQSGFFNRLTGFTNHVIDRSFEAGIGGTAALLSTPFGALAGKSMYEWGENPLTKRLAKGLEESEYTAKLSESYMKKGPIAKFFTGEGMQNEAADMIGFTLGMAVGAKGLTLINKGAGLLASPLAKGIGYEQQALRMANDGLFEHVLPTLAKKSSSYFSNGIRMAKTGEAAVNNELMFQGWKKGAKNLFTATMEEGAAGGLSSLQKGLTQIPIKTMNFFKDGTNTLSALTSFERTSLASYGEARVEASQSYQDIYETAKKRGYSSLDADKMAAEGANRTLGLNMLLLGMTNQFGMNNLFKPQQILPNLAKWLTKDYVFDNSTKLAWKNISKEVLENMAEGFVMEGFAEELGQFAISEGSKNYQLDVTNPVYKSFLQEFINAYSNGITSDEGMSNWFGGGLFGALTGAFGLQGGLMSALKQRKQAATSEIPTVLRAKMTKMNDAVEAIMKHTQPFNGQLYPSYTRDEQNNLIPFNQGTERFTNNPATIFQLAKALNSITTLTKDQVSTIVDATSLTELLANANEKDREVLARGFTGIKEYTDYIDTIQDTLAKGTKNVVAKSFIEYANDMTANKRADVMLALNALSTAKLSDKAVSAQQLIKEKILSNYVYTHVSNGVEDKLFDELDNITQDSQDPNFNIEEANFLGNDYKKGEEQKLQDDIREQRKQIQNQVNIYNNLRLRFGQPLSYEYLRNKDGNIEKHAITVPMFEVFRSAVVQKKLESIIKDNKDKIETTQTELLSVDGADIIVNELNKGLQGDLSNDKLTEKLISSDIKSPLKDILAKKFLLNKLYENELKKENKLFEDLINPKRIIKELHDSFVVIQDAIDTELKDEETGTSEVKKTPSNIVDVEDIVEDAEDTTHKGSADTITHLNNVTPDNIEIVSIVDGVIGVKDKKTGTQTAKTIGEVEAISKKKTSSNVNVQDELKKIDQENALLGASILNKLKYENHNRLPNGNVKGGQAGWKIRFNIKNTKTGKSYYDKDSKDTRDEEYNKKAEQLINFLYQYFGSDKTADPKKLGQHYIIKDDLGNEREPFKHLAGGEIGESDFTVYIGSADDVIKFISDIRTKNPEILDLLHTGNLSDDIIIDDIFKGRIEGAKIGFSGYHVPTNLKGIIGKDQFVFTHQGKRVIISYGKGLTDITVAVEGGNKEGESIGYNVAFDKEMLRDFPELYKNIRNIIGFQLYNTYLKGSKNEFVKLTGTKETVSDTTTKQEVNETDEIDEFDLNSALEIPGLLPELSLESMRSTIGEDYRNTDKKDLNPNEIATNHFFEGTEKNTINAENHYFQPYTGKNVPKDIKDIWTSAGYKPTDDDILLVVKEKSTEKPLIIDGSFVYISAPQHSQLRGELTDEEIAVKLMEKVNGFYKRYRFPFLEEIQQEENFLALPIEEQKQAIIQYMIDVFVPIVKKGLKERADFLKKLHNPVADLENIKVPITGSRQGSRKRTNEYHNVLDGIDIENVKININIKGKLEVSIDDIDIPVSVSFISDEDRSKAAELVLKLSKAKDKKEGTALIQELKRILFYQSLEVRKKTGVQETPQDVSNNRIYVTNHILYRGKDVVGVNLKTADKNDIEEYLKNMTYNISKNLLENDLDYREEVLKNRIKTNIDYSNLRIISKQLLFTFPLVKGKSRTVKDSEQPPSQSPKDAVQHPMTAEEEKRLKAQTAEEMRLAKLAANPVPVALPAVTPVAPVVPTSAVTSIEDNSVTLTAQEIEDSWNEIMDEPFNTVIIDFFKNNGGEKNFRDLKQDDRSDIFKFFTYVLKLTKISDLFTTKISLNNAVKEIPIESVKEAPIVQPIIDPLEAAKANTKKLFGKKKSPRLITREERDSYIREDIEAFREWMQKVLPQFPVETSKEVIDGIAEGMFYKNMITLWENAEEGTGFHEAFEAVWNTLLNKEQRDELRNEFKNRPGSFTYFFTKEKMNYKDASNKEIKESLAEEFRDFMLNPSLGTNQPSKNNFFIRLWNQLKELIKSLNPFQVKQVKGINNLFTSISKGDFKDLTPSIMYGEKEYRIIRDDVTYAHSNLILQTVKSQLFSKIADSTLIDDVLILTKSNTESLNKMLEEIRENIYNNIQSQNDSDLDILKSFFTPEGFAEYTLPHLQRHLASLKVTIELEDIQENEENRDKQNFIDSMFIDSKNLVGSDIKVLIHTLTDKTYENGLYADKLQPYQFIGENKMFVDGHKVINILQNVLSNTPSKIIRNGIPMSGLQLMYEKLNKFQIKVGKTEEVRYREGYEWIEELKKRLDKNIKLRMSFEKAFTTTRVIADKTLINNSKTDRVRSIDPVIDETITTKKLQYTDLFRQKHIINNNEEINIELEPVEITDIDYEKKDTKIAIFNKVLNILNIPINEFDYAKKNYKDEYIKIIENIYNEYNNYVKYMTNTQKKSVLKEAKEIYQFYKGFQVKDKLFGIGTDLNKLIKLNMDMDSNQLVFRNSEGKKEYSISNNTTWSQFLNTLNSVNTKQDLIDSLPYLKGANNNFKLSLQHSQILNNMFDKNGKKRKVLKDNVISPIKLNYIRINGIDIENKMDGESTAKLSQLDRDILRMYKVDNGIHYTMVNSDKNSEYAIDFGNLLTSDATYKLSQKDFTEHIWDTYGKHQLTVYNAMLNSPDRYEYFSKQLDQGNLGFFTKASIKTIKGLKKIDAKEAESNFKDQFLKNVKNQINELQTYSDYNHIDKYLPNVDVQKIVYSTILSSIEQHLLIYGDPMFYKLKDGVLDSPKRTSGANSNKEQILQSQEYWDDLYTQTVRLSDKDNDGLLNIQTFDDIEVMLKSPILNKLLNQVYDNLLTDPTYPYKENKVKIAQLLGIEDNFTVEDGVLSNISYKREGFVKSFLEMNEADGQGYILTDYYMDLMYRSVKLDQKQIDTLNWKKAKEISVRSNLDSTSPYYNKYTKEKRSWANKTLIELVSEPKGILGPLKPQYYGYSADELIVAPAFLKNSIMPLNFIDLWDEEKGEVIYPKAMDVYINAQENNIDIVGHRSGQKIGAIVGTNDEFVSIEDPTTLAYTQTLYETFLGIQTEMPNKRKTEILSGVQIRRIIKSNLAELAKTNPALQATLDEYDDVLNARYDKGIKELTTKLGIVKQGNEYVITNPKEVIKQLQDELNRLNLPDNVKDIIELNSNKDNIKFKLESSPNNYSLQSILFSIIDKSIVHQKVKGSANIQIAHSLFSKETRGSEEVVVNGVKKTVQTSTELGFAYNEEGEMIGMEVLIPNPFHDVYPDLTWEQFKLMAEKDPKLKELVAYRIPTQSLGQFEFITIKGFYNATLGDGIIVPSGIVAKAGSDFDIDKLFMYIPHVFKNKDGDLESVKYLTDDNSTIEERYKQVLKGNIFKLTSGIENNEDLAKQFKDYKETYERPILNKINAIINAKVNNSVYGVENAKAYQYFSDTVNKLSKDELKASIFKILGNKTSNIFDRQFLLQELYNERTHNKSLNDIDVQKLDNVLVAYQDYISTFNIKKEYQEIVQQRIKSTKGYMNYKSLLKDEFQNMVVNFVIKNDLAINPSFQEFSRLPLAAQNTTEALENRNIELMKALASYNKNTYTAYLPNNADTLKSLEKNKTKDNYDSLLSFDKQNQYRQANLSSKSLVGIAAVHVTGHAFTQANQTILTGTFTNDLGQTEDINVTLPLTEQEFKNLYGVWDTSGKLISANLSEFLSAIVDAAKDPFIFNLNINEDTLNTALYLTRLGVSLENITTFLKKPSIIQYLRLKGQQNSLFNKYLNEEKMTEAETQMSILTPLLKGISLGTFKKTQINESYFLNVNSKPDKENFEEKKQHLYEEVVKHFQTTPYELNGRTIYHEVYNLLNYLRYNSQSSNLGNVNRALSIDSKSPNSVAATISLQNTRYNLEKDGFILNPEELFVKNNKNTYIGSIHDNKELSLKMISNYQVLANKDIIDNLLSPIDDLLSQNKYISMDNKVKTMNKWQSFLLTYHVQTETSQNQDALYKTKDAILDNVLDLFQKVRNMSTETGHFKLFDLIVKTKPKGSDIDAIIKYRTQNETININTAIEELLEYISINEDTIEGDTVEEFLKALTKYSIIQSGFGSSTVAISNFIPLEYYTKYVSDAISTLYTNTDLLSDLPLSGLWDQFVRNNSTNKDIVDQIEYRKSGNEDRLSNGYISTKSNSNRGLMKTLKLEEKPKLYVRIENSEEKGELFRLAYMNKDQVQYEKVDFLGDGRFETIIEDIEEYPELTKIINDIKDNISYNRLNFAEMEEELPAVQDLVNEIYDDLGGQTISENVQILDFKDKTTGKYTNFDEIATEVGGINSLYNFQKKMAWKHFGNPFSDVERLLEAHPELLPTKSTEESVKRYIDWLLVGYIGELEISNEQYDMLTQRRSFILSQIKSGKFKNKPILYVNTEAAKKNAPSHATALDYLVNKFDWSQPLGTSDNIAIENGNDIPTTEAKVLSKEIDNVKSVTYTPTGKEEQLYTIKENKIYNKDNKEVFSEDSVDRNKIFANLAVKEGTAKVVNYNGVSYVVNQKSQIMSTVTGKIMLWDENNGNRKGILALFKDNNTSVKSTNKVVTEDSESEDMEIQISNFIDKLKSVKKVSSEVFVSMLDLDLINDYSTISEMLDDYIKSYELIKNNINLIKEAIKEKNNDLALELNKATIEEIEEDSLFLEYKDKEERSNAKETSLVIDYLLEHLKSYQNILKTSVEPTANNLKTYGDIAALEEMTFTYRNIVYQVKEYTKGENKGDNYYMEGNNKMSDEAFLNVYNKYIKQPIKEVTPTSKDNSSDPIVTNSIVSSTGDVKAKFDALVTAGNAETHNFDSVLKFINREEGYESLDKVIENSKTEATVIAQAIMKMYNLKSISEVKAFKIDLTDKKPCG